MIKGIGVDVVELARIDGLSERQAAFKDKIFTPREAQDCFCPKKDVARLAGRFAVKEAVSKALGTGIGKVGWKDIETINGKNGAPEVILHGEAKRLAETLGVQSIHCSISHEKSVAVAMIIMEG